MASAFDRTAAQTLDRSFAVFGCAATYTDRNAVATPCTVLVERDLTRYGEAATIAQRTAVVQVRATEVPAAPRRGERFTLAGTGQVLTVDSLVQSTDYLHRVFAS